MIYEPIVLDGIKLTSDREGSPSTLTFDVCNDGNINFVEGNNVRLVVGSKPMFNGFIFKKSRSKGKTIMVTAYDQIRYLKNKDTYNFTVTTASGILKRIAEDFSLVTGDVEDTGYVIASQPESNTTLLDMVQNALDTTLTYKNEMYVLFDDDGKLCLKSPLNMMLNTLITDQQAEDFSYESSIDSDTYNQIKLTYDNEDSGEREVYISKDSNNINKWGVLQHYEALKTTENARAKANALLNLYNTPTRTLALRNVIGDTECRAGCLIGVNLNLGDLVLNNYMLVEKCTHTFTADVHLMDITLRGSEINAS